MSTTLPLYEPFVCFRALEDELEFSVIIKYTEGQEILHLFEEQVGSENEHPYALTITVNGESTNGAVQEFSFTKRVPRPGLQQKTLIDTSVKEEGSENEVHTIVVFDETFGNPPYSYRVDRPEPA